MEQFVVFKLDDQPYCLRLANVERVIHVVEFVNLPKAPPIVAGIINFNGGIIPVVNLRKRFNLPERDLDLSSQLIVTRTASRIVALMVDSVTGVTETSSAEIIPADKIVPGSEYISGVIKLPDSMVLIHDIDTFLSLDEEKSLDAAVNELRSKK